MAGAGATRRWWLCLHLSYSGGCDFCKEMQELDRYLGCVDDGGDNSNGDGDENGYDNDKGDVGDGDGDGIDVGIRGKEVGEKG